MTLPRRSRRPSSAPLQTFVVFRAAGRRFALSTGQVTAVAEVPPVNRLSAPGRPEVLGLVAHRGRALPLVDLGRCLDGPAAAAAGGTHCIVVEHGERRAAFPVADLEGLARVPGGALPPGCETFDPVQVVLAAGRERTR
ncbi:MAG TPA: chemotaxis protein CheW [Thermoanaerobaculia bacterium]|nr:chemotaxis protein CheW [Thermoanaerobaculia bacterium]